MAEVRHLKKFAGGRTTPQKMHADLAFPRTAKCGGCQRKPLIRAITLAPLDEMRRRQPGLDALMTADPNGFMSQIVKIRENSEDKAGKPYLRVGVAYACESCKKSLEQAAAKSPSWCIVEFNYGPKETIQVGA